MGRTWGKGRGKLGFLAPLIGAWVAQADSPLGPLRCTRTLAPVLAGKYVQLTARWEYGAPGKPGRSKPYEEIALIGADENGLVTFWSYTSDGRRSQGVVADVTDIDPRGIGFEARMPAGVARMAYWPDHDAGFFWAVESKTARGWNRFLLHHYLPA